MTGKVTVIGLGAGDLEQLPVGIYRLLQQEKHIYMRTKEHPVIKELESEGLTYVSYDDVYESYDGFEEVYEHISNDLIDKASVEEVVYAVPGHPLVAERTVQLLLQKEKNAAFLLKLKGTKLLRSNFWRTKDRSY